MIRGDHIAAVDVGDALRVAALPTLGNCYTHRVLECA